MQGGVSFQRGYGYLQGRVSCPLLPEQTEAIKRVCIWDDRSLGSRGFVRAGSGELCCKRSLGRLIGAQPLEVSHSAQAAALCAPDISELGGEARNFCSRTEQ